MGKLKIEEIPCNGGLRTMRISGFRENELYNLKSMEHRESQEKLIEMLDARNGSIGTCWANGYGVYGIWFDNEYAYVNIGSTCD